MTKINSTAIFLFCFSWFLMTLGCSSQVSNSSGDITLDMQAPEIVGVDLDGREFKLSDYRGKVVMLSFWADW